MSLRPSEPELFFVTVVLCYFALRLVAFVYRVTREGKFTLGPAFKAGLMLNLYITVAHLSVGIIDVFSTRFSPLPQGEMSLFGPVLLVFGIFHTVIQVADMKSYAKHGEFARRLCIVRET